MYQVQFQGDGGVNTGVWTLQDDLTVQYDIYFRAGSFVSNGYDVKARSIYADDNDAGISIDFSGTDKITLRWRFEIQSNPTFNIGSADVYWENMEGDQYRLYGSNNTFNDLYFDHDDGANPINIEGNNTVNNVNIESNNYLK